MITMVMSSPRYGISSSWTWSSGTCRYLNRASWYIMRAEQVRAGLTWKSETYTLSLSNLFLHSPWNGNPVRPAAGSAHSAGRRRYLEVDGVDQDQDRVGVQNPWRQCVLDQVAGLVGDPAVDGEPGPLRVPLQDRAGVTAEGAEASEPRHRLTLKSSGSSLAP